MNLRHFIALLTGLALLASAATAADSNAWQFEQSFPVAAPGAVQWDLSPAVLDASRLDLGDLRLRDPGGVEVPFRLVQPGPGRLPVRRAADFKVELTRGATVITFATGITQALARVTLESPATRFVKGVTVEGMAEGQRWELIARGRQIFREPGGAGALSFDVPPKRWTALKLTVDDSTSPPVPFTGAVVAAAEEDAVVLVPVPVRIVNRAEGDGETRLTLDLGAAHLQLASLDLVTEEPLFQRSIELAARELERDTVVEHTLARGAIQHAPGGPPEQRVLALDERWPARELILLVANADNPPLRITGVRVERRPTVILFYAERPGKYTLVTGNPQSMTPHYELPAALARLPVRTIEASAGSALRENPSFQPAEPLPEISGQGAPLDVSDWSMRKQVELVRASVAELALDPEVLAAASPGLGDLRLLRDGRQIPYLVERTSLREKIVPAFVAAPDAQRPNVSRWRLKLPVAGLPLTSLTAHSGTTLFEREVVVRETARDALGEKQDRELGRATWRSSPDRPAPLLTLALHSPPTTDELTIEIANGDNPAIDLRGFECWYPVTRLLFKAPAADSVFLYYGNASVFAPQYDLRLVAPQLLAAERIVAKLGPQEPLRRIPHSPGQAGWVFWLALAAVVAGLLAVIAKLMPRAPVAQ